MTEKRLIAVDIGNSSTKLGWFDEGSSRSMSQSVAGSLPLLAATHSFTTGQEPPAELLGVLPGENCRWHIVSVHREGTRLLTAWLQTHRGEDDVRLLTCRDLPIVTEVDFPDRVGLDRLAAAVAANILRDPGSPAIVIDAGSAITVDLVTGDGSFAGGVILPGFRMAAEALYGGADLLPLALLEPNSAVPSVIGKDTEAAIRSGLFWGALGAVREIISRMSAQLDHAPQVFVTGGDLRQLAKHLGDEVSFVPNLVLCGIALAARRL
jgi:type III pantothenate kinase